MVSEKIFNIEQEGIKLKEYTLSNDKITAVVINRGGAVKNIWVKDKNGEAQDVVLGYDTAEEYVEDYTIICYGALVGRYANRIINAKFELNGKTIELEKNNGEHHLHGKFTYRFLESRVLDENSVEMTLVSTPDEEGFPGTLNLSIIYSVTEEGGLVINYKATADEDTVINVTNHSYFNLNGQKGEGIEDHILTINADTFTSLTPQRILTGDIVSVDNTSLDFRKGEVIGEAIKGKDEQMAIFNSLDHNFIFFDKNEYKHAGNLYSKNTGISMDMYTTEPACQVYIKQEYEKEVVKADKNRKHSAICFEAQHYPSSVTFPNFPTTILRKGDTYKQTTEYRFSVK